MSEFQNFLPTTDQKWVLHMIFLRIPKNASTSVYHALGHYNLVNKYKKDFVEKNLKSPLYRGWFDPTHAKPNEIKQILPVDPNSYFSFAIVRNPWDRFVSMFAFAKKYELWRFFTLKEPTFQEFCSLTMDMFETNNPFFFPSQDQCQWLEGAFEPTKILKFENLQKEFADMVHEFQMNHIYPSLPHENSSEHLHYREYFSLETQKIVGKIFARDIDCFKYTF